MTKNNRGEASCLPSILLSVSGPRRMGPWIPRTGPFGPVLHSASTSSAVLRRGPRRASEPTYLRTRRRSFPSRPEGRKTGASAHRPVARPETEGRFPAPGRDVATAATPAVTRNASGVLFEAAAAGLAEEARRGG